MPATAPTPNPARTPLSQVQLNRPNILPINNTAVATKSVTNRTIAMMVTTAPGRARRAGGSGFAEPDVCAESGGVSPGGTLASTPGVFAGSGSGGSDVTGDSSTS